VSRLDTTAAGWDDILTAVEGIRSDLYPEIHSLLIARDDSLVFELYHSGHNSMGEYVEYDIDTPHEAQSATKSFRSAMVGIAIERGFISGVDASVLSFFPELANLSTPEKDAITLEHVLTMSTGLEWDETSGGMSNSLTEMYGRPAAEWAGFVLGRPLADQPGFRFVYNTGTSILQALIVEHASGMSWPAFVREYWADPVESMMTPGIGWTLGGEILPRDMARLGQVYLRRGMWKDRRVVPSDWVTRSIDPVFQVPAAGASYGYQWWIRTYYTPSGTYLAYHAAGNGGQFIIVVDDLNLVAVFTGGNFGSSTAGQAHEIMRTKIIPGVLKSAR
jgi:CubicO group peptidase (beta-lactamase class C family)